MKHHTAKAVCVLLVKEICSLAYFFYWLSARPLGERAYTMLAWYVSAPLRDMPPPVTFIVYSEYAKTARYHIPYGMRAGGVSRALRGNIGRAVGTFYVEV